jgi:peptidoglycan/xylan/chitin deacetylase (PgdA/CDA1 family)
LKSNNKLEFDFTYVVLCYHYLRQNKDLDKFPRILGTNITEFKNQLSMLDKNYEFISLDHISNSFDKKTNFHKKSPKILLTFDDGLSDHYTAAKILNELNISGVFFVPTCIIEDKLPANPIIIHYTLAIFGIELFLKEYKKNLEILELDSKLLDVSYSKNDDNVWDLITKIKSIFKYQLGYTNSRKILLNIYENLLCQKYDNPLEIMHLTESQIKKMIAMGHYVGAHTHSHISIAATELSSTDFIKEIIHPKNYLEKKFNTQINSLSYPFGGINDCLSTSELLKKTNEYDVAFTVEEIANTNTTPRYTLGRYQLTSTDNSLKLNNTIKKMLQEN